MMFLCNYKFDFFPEGYIQRLYTEEKDSIRISGFFLLNLDTHKNRKNYYFCRHSISFSLQLQAYLLPVNSQLKVLLSWRRVRFGDICYSSLHRNLESPKFPESFYWKYIICIIEKVFLHNSIFDFLPEFENQQPLT